MFLSININQNYIYVSRIIELQHDTSYCINLTNNYLTSLECIFVKLLQMKVKIWMYLRLLFGLRDFEKYFNVQPE